ncbi:hypothetical protein [Acinetobacter pragensis]|uniref:Uncharacterized protein n=1 Tax=Acinetobacter pragensis TaxID=1806892 RepID=A0A151Y5J0_9GAMM|nr:hypothetical protein [Acinetobacter pragensis]KYQ73311.1 hypothetical protein AZH43_06365 [Acinetobacter pragensis]
MYINDVMSYLGGWEIFNKNHSDLLDDIKATLEIVSEKLYKEYKSSNLQDGANSNFNVLGFIRQSLIDEFERIHWNENNLHTPFKNERVQFLGLMKESCYIKITTSAASSILMSWIYRDIESANKLANISVPILLVIDISQQSFLNQLAGKNSNFDSHFTRSRSLKFIKNSLDKVSPLKFEHPFLILGVKLEKTELNIINIESENLKIDNNIKMDRCITFEPEYYQAGLAILTYFGSVLKEKYPEQNATVKIEQHDLTVRMIIETEDGNIETLEKALHEYELVLKGQESVDEFYLSPIKTLELKNQLNLFKFQIDSQKEIIALQHGRILSLEAIIDKALSPVVHPPVTIINQLNNSQSTVINYKAELSKSNDELEELIDLSDSEALKNRLATIQNALEVNRNADQPEEIKDSNGMKKLAKFLKDANEVGTEANTLAKKGGKALDLIKSLGRRYNSIAEWCGMPNIPAVFVKE